MTRKDYVKLASALREVRAILEDGRDGLEPVPVPRVNRVVRLAAKSIADVLKADNASFDRERFYDACEGRAV